MRFNHLKFDSIMSLPRIFYLHNFVPFRDFPCSVLMVPNVFRCNCLKIVSSFSFFDSEWWLNNIFYRCLQGSRGAKGRKGQAGQNGQKVDIGQSKPLVFIEFETLEHIQATPNNSKRKSVTQSFINLNTVIFTRKTRTFRNSNHLCQ